MNQYSINVTEWKRSSWKPAFAIVLREDATEDEAKELARNLQETFALKQASTLRHPRIAQYSLELRVRSDKKVEF